MDCIFCKIIEKKAPAKIVFEDDETIVFHDIHPSAPIHLLICPKKHYSALLETPPEVLPTLFRTVKKVAEQLGVDEDGFRLIINQGPDGGQIVYHLHIHFLAGRKQRGF
jgi:histidine triad (HIT) family protein